MQEIGFNKSKGLVFSILCPHCETETHHIVIQSTEIVGRDEFDEISSINWETKHQIIQCQGCSTISYREENINSEDYDPQTGTQVPLVRLYPLRNKNTLYARDFLNSPPTLKRIYREVIDAFNNQLFTLSAAGLRQLIQGIYTETRAVKNKGKKPAKGSKEQACDKATLPEHIRCLHERGFLSTDHAEILAKSSWLGEEELHELSIPMAGELELVIQIVEMLLEAIFESPFKGSKPKRRLLWRSKP